MNISGEFFFSCLRGFSFRRDLTIDGRVNNDCKNSESVGFNVNEYEEYLNDDC